MLPPPLLLLLLLIATGPTTALTEDEKQTMVDLHNQYRAQVSPPASDMLQMRWDDELAAFAKAYAQKCVWGHNKERGRRGENLFAITDEGMDVPLAVGNWHEEHEYYNFSTATCDPNQMCGHYTQVVWSKTERIGCGSHFCETLQGVEEANIHLLVCNYEPPGNVKGRKPYQEGTPCSQCPLGYSCENSLCEPMRNPEKAQDSPPRVTEVPSTRATEAPSSRETGTPSLATSETLHFSVTKVSDSLATESSPAVETKAPSSLATEGPSSMATEAQAFVTEVPLVSARHMQPSVDEGPVNFLTSTHIPVPKSMDEEASKSSATSVSPKKSLYPKMSLTESGESVPQIQEEAEPKDELSEPEAILPEAEAAPTEAEVELREPEAESPKAESPEAEAESPLSSEALVPVLPAQERGGQKASLEHSGHPASPSLPTFPSASGNATGGRTLALQSSWTGAENPEKADWDLKNSAHVWGPFLGLLLPSLLLLAGMV
nr:cysteine-rich protease inhibitor [Mus musculus]BAB03453.1 cysteine-rich protease inhibitor [Mus musculus]